MTETDIRLVIIGDLAFDQLITPRGTQKTVAGGAYNVAVAASLVSTGGEIGLVAKAGRDFLVGVEALQRRGINTEGLICDPNTNTTIFTITELTDGSRSLSTENPVTLDLNIFPQSYRRAKHIHLASSHPDGYLEWLPYLREIIPPETTISADGNDLYSKIAAQSMKKALDLVDLVFINEQELADINAVFPGSEFTKPTILKRGRNGATYKDLVGKLEIHVPAPSVLVKDTTGAGDALAGVYLMNRLIGIDIQESLRQAVNVASLAVTEFGVDHINP